MIEYLSEEWLTRAADAISASPELSRASEGQDVTIAYEITGAPSGKINYGLSFKDGSASLARGKQSGVGASFSLDYQTASEIARGDLSAQAAFMQGRMKLDGDVTVLISQYRLIDETEDALADLRAETAY